MSILQLRFEQSIDIHIVALHICMYTQVLSESVALALHLTGGESAHETAKFIRMVDRFFDCLNVTSYDEGKRKRKIFLQPYRSENDFRFKVYIAIIHYVQYIS